MTSPVGQPAIQAVFDAILSVPLASGHFDSVNGFEPKSAPRNGLTAAVWLERVRPVQSRSGLASVGLAADFSVRLYTPMLSTPPDAIDPRLMVACCALMTAYAGDFDLAGAITAIDLLGAWGDAGLSAEAGYLQQDGSLFRVLTITIPCIIDDALAEVQ